MVFSGRPSDIPCSPCSPSTHMAVKRSKSTFDRLCPLTFSVVVVPHSIRYCLPAFCCSRALWRVWRVSTLPTRGLSDIVVGDLSRLRHLGRMNAPASEPRTSLVSSYFIRSP
ncbi:hypothetical protein PV04_08861 [Phialophora macrospora]|uniref:Uncharacterized protein n=1 Tax=Phialophora macrospora TaxID=1851006 RepID=A0A0D2F7C5_9EURO|nr:hypothetical protein PV04_08861 [Phialophora macrospora]